MFTVLPGVIPEPWEVIISDTIEAVVVSSACSASDGGLGACIAVSIINLGLASDNYT